MSGPGLGAAVLHRDWRVRRWARGCPASRSEQPPGGSSPGLGIVDLRVAWPPQAAPGSRDTTAVPKVAIHVPCDREHLLTKGALGEGLGAPGTQTPTGAAGASPLFSAEQPCTLNQCPRPGHPPSPLLLAQPSSSPLCASVATVPSTRSTLPNLFLWLTPLILLVTPESALPPGSLP